MKYALFHNGILVDTIDITYYDSPRTALRVIRYLALNTLRLKSFSITYEPNTRNY